MLQQDFDALEEWCRLQLEPLSENSARTVIRQDVVVVARLVANDLLICDHYQPILPGFP